HPQTYIVSTPYEGLQAHHRPRCVSAPRRRDPTTDHLSLASEGDDRESDRGRTEPDAAGDLPPHPQTARCGHGRGRSRTTRGPFGEAPDDERQGVQRVPQPDSRGTKAPPLSQGVARKSRSRGAEGLELADFLARDHDALDLGRPFPDLKDLRIPHPLLHR